MQRTSGSKWTITGAHSLHADRGNWLSPTTPRQLLEIDSKRKATYRGHSLVHLTAYSVYWLTEWGIPTTYENVSVLNGRLFPSDFAMQGFPELPDALRTNRSLLQMRPKYRGFATSNPRTGVHLTEKGKSAAEQVLEKVGPPTFNGEPVRLEAPEVDPRRPAKDRERTRSPAQTLSDIRSKILFRRYSEGRLDETEIVHFLGLVGMYDHTLPAEVRRAFVDLRKDAEAVGDQEVMGFLEAVATRFSAYLNRPDPRKRRRASQRG